MAKYLTNSWMYNTGFIPAKDTSAREQQGLESQLIANACVLPSESYVPYTGECKSYGDKRPYRYNYQSNIVNADMKNLYPLNATQVDYGLKPIPNDCPCLDFLHEYN